MGINYGGPPKTQAVLENWWGNGPKPRIMWSYEEWLAWANLVIDDSILRVRRPPPYPRPRPAPSWY